MLSLSPPKQRMGREDTNNKKKSKNEVYEFRI